MRLMNYNLCSQNATVISASSEDANFPASNLKHPFRSKRWRSTGTSSESVVFDMVTSEPIDSVVLLWPKEDGIRLSNTAVVKIQANATNVWTSPAIDQTLVIDNTYVVASHFFTSDQSYRYWRVIIQDPGNPNGFVELGVVWLGKGLPLEATQNGFKFSLLDPSNVTTTDFGHTYVDEYPLLSTLDFTYQYLDYEVVQALENAFRANGTKLPVLVVLDVEESVFNKNHFLVYGKFKNAFGLQHYIYNILNPDSLTITELA